MSFFLSPFLFVFELIGFLISAAFVYGLALIAAVTFIAYGISTTGKPKTIIETVTVVEMHEVTKFVEKGPELTCTRLSGCKINIDAKTEEEYCPSCVMK
jgi:hypothetical protein|tara:strand:- start:571 stop:867 length:297 start_codon:yes stop_codon:yes gene_type:complete